MQLNIWTQIILGFPLYPTLHPNINVAFKLKRVYITAIRGIAIPFNTSYGIFFYKKP